MTASHHPFVYTESDEAINEEIIRRKRMWYSIKPLSYMMTGLLLICLFIVPVTLGQDMGLTVLQNVGMSFAASLLGALLLGWLGWRLFLRSDLMANLFFCLVLIASGIWATGLTNHQRNHAENIFQDTIGTHLATVTDKARDLFEVGD